VGAGVYNADSLRVSRTSISANVVTDPRGAAEGGGVYVDDGSKKTALAGSTVTGNRVAGAHAHGGGIFFAGGAPVTLTGTVVTGNSPDDCFPPGRIAGCGAGGRGAPDLS
jgi:hypothetical protein